MNEIIFDLTDAADTADLLRLEFEKIIMICADLTDDFLDKLLVAHERGDSDAVITNIVTFEIERAHLRAVLVGDVADRGIELCRAFRERVARNGGGRDGNGTKAAETAVFNE